MMGRIIIAVFVAIVILVECVVAYMLIPSADSVAAAAKEKISQEIVEQESGEESAEDESEDNTTFETELGRFNITLYQHTSNTTLHVNFVLVGTALESERVEFETLYANNQHRLRDKVLLEIRSAELTDLNEPGLGLIKRRILEKSNDLFGKPLLTSIVFSEFTFHEQ